MREKARRTGWGNGLARIFAHNNLSAAAMAMTVSVKLIHGPQSIVPTMMATAKRGKNDRATATPLREKKPCDRRSMFHSIPLGCALGMKQRRTVSAPGGNRTDAARVLRRRGVRRIALNRAERCVLCTVSDTKAKWAHSPVRVRLSVKYELPAGSSSGLRARRGYGSLVLGQRGGKERFNAEGAEVGAQRTRRKAGGIPRRGGSG
jgi:hypothetical protein